MAVSHKIKKIAVTGLAALTLGATFNNAALGNAAPAPTQPQTVQTQATPNTNVLGQEIVKTMKHLDDYYRNPLGISRTHDDVKKRANESLDKVVTLLQQGANPNYVDPQSGISAFAWSLWMSYESDRTDVVEAFLKAGADPRQKLPANTPLPEVEKTGLRHLGIDISKSKNGISLLDHAVAALGESQTLYATHVETAIKIIRTLQGAGLTIDDLAALRLADKKSFADYVTTFMGLDVMVEQGFAPKEYRDELLDVTPSEQRELMTQQVLTEAFLKKHGADLADFSDAIPGGPEPYKTEKGETLESIAQRFSQAMGAPDLDKAVEMLAAQNGITLDPAGTARSAVMVEGTKILIPVPVEHQIGGSPIAKHAAILGMAYRLKDEMKVNNVQDAINIIVQENKFSRNSNFAKLLAPGASVKYKVKGETATRDAQVKPEDALYGLALSVAGGLDIQAPGQPHKKGATVEDAVQHIATMNGLDLAAIKAGTAPVDMDRFYWMTFFNDTYLHLDALTPPKTLDPDHKVSLVVIETGSDEPNGGHHKRTFSAAAGSAYALNHGTDMSRFFALREDFFTYPSSGASDALRMLMNLKGSPLQDKVIFSFSMAYAIDHKAADARLNNQPADHMNYETARRLLDEMMENKPIVFGAAGNWRQNVQGRGNGDGRYVQSYYVMLSPRAVNIGAAGNYPNVSPNGNTTISHYSSYGGDICGILPDRLGDQEEGTSFSTPTFAAISQRMMEWYGNVLSFEEVMAAGMMVGAYDVSDYDPVGGNMEKTPAGARSVPAISRTNGAGLRVQERCGAGLIDRHTAVQWNETLKKMVDMKLASKNDAAFRTYQLDFGNPANVNKAPDGTTEYIYRVTMPQDMTLGKLVFMLPREREDQSDVYVKAPSGFEVHLPKSYFDIVPTRAFVAEDVKAGQTIEIRTAKPLAKGAGMYLLGHDDGNTIQMMRDYLAQQKVLSPPLMATLGGTLISDREAKDIMEMRRKKLGPHTAPESPEAPPMPPVPTLAPTFIKK